MPKVYDPNRINPATGEPWQGTTLAVDDPHAWAYTIFSGDRIPTQEETRAHVAWCKSQDLLNDEKIPVRWEFLPLPHGKALAYWETSANLIETE